MNPELFKWIYGTISGYYGGYARLVKGAMAAKRAKALVNRGIFRKGTKNSPLKG